MGIFSQETVTVSWVFSSYLITHVITVFDSVQVYDET